jgi:HEAT repeat protein
MRCACRRWLVCSLAGAVALLGVVGCTNRSERSSGGSPSEVAKKLKDPDANVRAQAAENLRNLGHVATKAAIPDLVIMLGDEDERCRRWAAEALGTLGEDGYGPLMEATKSENPHARAMSWHGITGLGVEVYEKHQAEYAKALAVALKDENLPTRQSAACSFFRHNSSTPDAIAVAAAAIEENDDKRVLCYLIDGMRTLSDEQKKQLMGTIPRLRKLAAGDDTEVKGQAGSLLVMLEKLPK